MHKRSSSEPLDKKGPEEIKLNSEEGATDDKSKKGVKVEVVKSTGKSWCGFGRWVLIDHQEGRQSEGQDVG